MQYTSRYLIEELLWRYIPAVQERQSLDSERRQVWPGHEQQLSSQAPSPHLQVVSVPKEDDNYNRSQRSSKSEANTYDMTQWLLSDCQLRGDR